MKYIAGFIGVGKMGGALLDAVAKSVGADKVCMFDTDASKLKSKTETVGTVSIETSELISQLLKRRGIKHEVLNAKFHEKEAEIISQNGATIVHNPCSNMKLASGVFDSRQARKYNCKISLGTDGNSSNNNLSMIEEMKIASLLAKIHYLDSEEGNSNTVFSWATKNGAEAVGINAGEIKEGGVADLMFVNLDNEKMQPNYNIISNLIYSADTSCVDSLMCDGKFVMKHYYVEGEEEIIEIAKRYK